MSRLRVPLATLLLAVTVITDPSAASARERSQPDRVTFESDGVPMVGYHYRAAGSARRPVVVMGIGFGSTQDMGLPGFAARFADAGYDAFTFDYRHWGESGGTPRELLDVASQLNDYRAAIATSRRLPHVDPHAVVLWGSSFSGGHVLQVAADDPRISAVIAQVPHVDGIASAAAIPLPTLVRLTVAAIDDVTRGLLGRPPHYVPVTAAVGGFAVLPQPGALEGYRSVAGPTWPNRVAARVALQVPFYSPASHAPRSTAPTWIGVGHADVLTPPAPAVALARRMGATLREYDGGHFDVYPGAPLFPQVVADQIAFLRATVPSSAASTSK